MNEIASNILQSIDIIVDKKLKDARFNTTIVGEVIKSNHPLYIIKYQDLLLEVYSLAPEYKEKQLVYVLIPFNDLNKNKYILGAVGSSTLNVPGSSGGIGSSEEIQRLSLELAKNSQNDAKQTSAISGLTTRVDNLEKNIVSISYTEIDELFN